MNREVDLEMKEGGGRDEQQRVREGDTVWEYGADATDMGYLGVA